MSSPPTIPQITIRRLSLYLRLLNGLQEEGTPVVSSQELAALLDLNPAQVRKDLAYFGEFGKRGVGYSVSRLRDHIIGILGVQRCRNVAIIGAGGYLGHALAAYKGFEKRNFKVVALFDKDPHVIGQTVGEIGAIRHISELPELARQLQVEILILTVPAPAIKEVSDFILLSGVRAVLNFAPVKLPALEGVLVHSVDVVLELESLSYRLADAERAPGEDGSPDDAGGGSSVS